MTARILVPRAAESFVIQAPFKSAPFGWVDLRGLDEDNVRVMRDVFRFHPLATGDT